MTTQDFSQRLEREVSIWLQEELITAEQAQILTERYAKTTSKEHRPIAGEAFATWLLFSGASLLGIGVIIFFASNWQAIPGWVKLLSIFASVTLSYGAGYRFGMKGQPFKALATRFCSLGHCSMAQGYS